MDKTELPTESKLNELRERGIVPYSPYATHCLRSAAALFAFSLASPSCFRSLKTWLRQDDPLSAPPSVGHIVWMPAGLAVLAALVLVMMQRVGRGIFLVAPGASLSTFVPFLASLGLGAVVTGIVAWSITPILFSILTVGPGDIERWCRSTLPRVVGILGVCMVVSGIAVYAFTRWRFMMAHRMTRAELRAEQEGTAV
jgi:flagellar biosynthesis protein FlhB